MGPPSRHQPSARALSSLMHLNYSLFISPSCCHWKGKVAQVKCPKNTTVTIIKLTRWGTLTMLHRRGQTGQTGGGGVKPYSVDSISLLPACDLPFKFNGSFVTFPSTHVCLSTCPEQAFVFLLFLTVCNLSIHKAIVSDQLCANKPKWKWAATIPSKRSLISSESLWHTERVGSARAGSGWYLNSLLKLIIIGLGEDVLLYHYASLFHLLYRGSL